MEMKNLLGLIILVLVISNCTKKENTTTAELLQNENGWFVSAYRYVDTEGDVENVEFENVPPYGVLGVYANGFKFKENGECYFDYSDGTTPIEEGQMKMNWKLQNNEEIVFINDLTHDPAVEIIAKIIELDEDFLRIKYENKHGIWEYKFNRIQ